MKTGHVAHLLKGDVQHIGSGCTTYWKWVYNMLEVGVQYVGSGCTTYWKWVYNMMLVVAVHILKMDVHVGSGCTTTP